MIDLVLRESPQRLENVARCLSGTIANLVHPFTRDGMLARTEDQQSLTNYCLFKLHKAIEDFVYQDDLSEEHNERRFIALAKTYMSRQLIDLQYSANLGIRKPDGGLASLEGVSGDEEWSLEPPDRHTPRPEQVAMAHELEERLLDEFEEDSLERQVISMLRRGYTIQGIARCTGERVSRVSYLIYHRVQPALQECVACG